MFDMTLWMGPPVMKVVKNFFISICLESKELLERTELVTHGGVSRKIMSNTDKQKP